MYNYYNYAWHHWTLILMSSDNYYYYIFISTDHEHEPFLLPKNGVTHPLVAVTMQHWVYYYF